MDLPHTETMNPDSSLTRVNPVAFADVAAVLEFFHTFFDLEEPS